MKKYDIIYADPAWQYDSGRCLTTKSLLDGVSNEHYGAMTIDDLKNLPVSKIANENSLWKRNVVLAYNSCIAAAYWPHNLLFNQLIKLNNIKYESNEQNPRTEAGRSSEVYA